LGGVGIVGYAGPSVRPGASLDGSLALPLILAHLLRLSSSDEEICEELGRLLFAI